MYDDESKTALIFSSTDTSRCQIVGTDKGTYGLEVTSVDNGEATTFTTTDISTTPETIHEYTIDWDILSQGGEGVTVQIDSDGDGTFEKSFNTDNDLTRVEYMFAVGICFISTAVADPPTVLEQALLLMSLLGLGLIGSNEFRRINKNS